MTTLAFLSGFLSGAIVTIASCWAWIGYELSRSGEEG